MNGAGDFRVFVEGDEASVALELKGWMQERAPPPHPRGVSALLLPQSHCDSEGTQFRPVVFVSESSTRRRRRHPQLADLKAMFWVFTELHHLFVPTAFSGTS